MSNNKIEVNQGYRLTGTMDGMKRKLCFVCGRQGRSITLLLVNEITTATVQYFDREFAHVHTHDGVYNLQPCNRITDLQEVADVCEIIRSAPYEN